MSLAFAATLCAAAAFVSAALTALARRYALSRQLLDMPGHRRSHRMATPRGGGIAPFAATLTGGALLVSMHPQARALGFCLVATTAVAVIGWLDDHRPLSGALRLSVHAVAALTAALAVLGTPATATQAMLLALSVCWIVSLVNAWNFMDGIDGLATTQAVLVAVCVFAGGLLYAWLDSAWSGFALVFAGALLGFLPFNYPRARIFLGDVGSGALGFVIACLLLRAVASGGMPWPLALLPVSAFLVDSGLTLAKRVVQSRAWWRPHREHLYQWLVRSGITHAKATMAYALWTLASCLIVLAFGTLTARRSAGISVAALLSTVLLWIGARKRLWINAKTSDTGIRHR